MKPFECTIQTLEQKINWNSLIITGIDTRRAKARSLYYLYTSTTTPKFILTRTSTSASDLHLRPKLRPPLPTSTTDSATDLRYRPPLPTPLPTSDTDLRYRPPLPTSATDLRLHRKDINAPIYGIVGARIAFEGIAILKILSMMSVIRNFQSLLCSLYVQSDDVKHSVQYSPIM